MTIPDDAIIHRVGGAGVANLRLSPLDAQATPPGISVLAGRTPREAADQMRRTFKGAKWRTHAGTVGTATAAAIRSAGFDVVALATGNLPNHARVVHPAGGGGFTDAELAVLATVFVTHTGC